MSKVTEIKQRAIQLSEQSKKVAGSLRAYKSRFDTLIAQVKSSIGGTATGADADSINYLLSVKQSVDDAVQSLERASQETRQWADKL